MGGIKILGTGRAHLQDPITNDELAKTVDTSHEWIFSRTGISQRYFTDLTATEMAYQASMDAINNTDVDRKQIRYVIVATLSGEVLPNVSSMLQDKLHLSNDVLAFDLNAACSGFLYGLQVATSMLKDDELALVVGVEKLSQLLDFEDRSTCVLFGDGAGACIVGKTEKESYQFAQVHSDTNGYLKLTDHIEMAGRDVFRFAVSAMQESIENVLEQASLTSDDIDLVISHQANIRIIDHVAKKLNIPSEKMYTNVSSFGNTSAASIAIALACANEEGKLQRGMHVVLVGFGGGLTNGAIYFEW